MQDTHGVKSGWMLPGNSDDEPTSGYIKVNDKKIIFKDFTNIDAIIKQANSI